MIEFPCPFCDEKVEAPDDFAGRRARCPECNEAVEVPKAAEAPESTGDPAEPIKHVVTIFSFPTMSRVEHRYSVDELDEIGREKGGLGYDPAWAVSNKVSFVENLINTELWGNVQWG